MIDKTLHQLLGKYRVELNNFLHQLNPQLKDLNLEELRAEFYALNGNPNLPEQIKEQLSIIMGEIYKICYFEYKEIAKYLFKNNKELYLHLKPRIERRPSSIKEILDIIEFFNKLEEYNRKYEHKKNGNKDIFIFLLGQPGHYQKILKQFTKVNSFYFTFQTQTANYYIFNVLGIKSDFNPISGSSFADVEHYINSHLENLKPDFVLIFGLCASLQKQYPKNSVLFPSSINCMYPKGKIMQLLSSDLLKIKNNEIVSFNNIFSDIGNDLPKKPVGFFQDTKNISVSNLYTKSAYISETLISLVQKLDLSPEEKQTYIDKKVDKKFNLGSTYLHKYFDSLEMESYAIIKRFKNVKNIGFYLQVAGQIIVETNEHHLIEEKDGGFNFPLDFEMFLTNISFIINYYLNKL